MSLIFCDSFDDRDIAHIPDRYEAGGGEAIAPGRTGNGLVLSTGILDAYQSITKEFAPRQTIYVGVARNARISTALCSIRYNGVPHIYAQLNEDGTISVIRFDDGSPVVVLATSSRRIPDTGFYYVQLMGKIDPVHGAYELRIDRATWLSANEINTSSTGDSLSNQVRLIYNHPSLDGATTIVDDFYIADDDADGGDALIVGFAGPVHIGCLLPTGEGAASDGTPVGADTNHEAVGETTGEDGDTSYVAWATDNAVDLYALPNLDFSRGAIKAVALQYWVRREDMLYRAIQPAVRVGAANYFGDPQQVYPGAYQRIQTFLERSPATGLPWSVGEINALQAGARSVTSP